ncbi:SAFB-like transcription modulator [Sabethes cyaneus]|uniref:SAFB-like transcription modulator n=1 Tax=Sabethes cyaneus TaxID=53552 RepID=UPI00237E0F24|nr:SAFB-like transcription modulator [Sabethes cyaneus]
MADVVEKRKLSELRVVDLKQELEKRGKDGNGVKNVLIERLTQALKDEKQNPETYEFEIVTAGKTPAKKGKPATGNSKTDGDADASGTTDAANGESGGDLNMEEMTVQDECKEEEKAAKDESKSSAPEQNGEATTEGTPSTDNATDADKAGKEDTKEADNEDSLNLTIGEEDEKLLHDDSNIENEKKGEAGKAAAADSKTDGKADEEKKTEKSESSSDKTATTKEEKESGSSKTSSSAKSAGDSKSKSSPSSSEKSAGTTSTVSRNLWVSGLSSLTRATDLKLIFSKYGKVIGAKVVTNTRTPGTRCYGYVTMASAKDATECITHLHRTELHGRMISVERAKSDLGPSKPTGAGGGKSESSAKSVDGDLESRDKTDRDDRRRDDSRGGDRRYYRSRSQYRGRSPTRNRSPIRGKSQVRSRSSPTKDDKPRDDKKDADNNKDEKDKEGAKKEGERGSRDGDRQSRDGDRRDGNRSRDRERDVLSLQKIREERERQRLREKERQLREEDRRRREIRARQREEEQLLRREREKLALERARIEKEKAELLRIERERQKLEREKIELERLELKRQQRKIEEAKRNLKRPATDHAHYDEDRKRSAGSDRRFEAPPPPSISSSGRGSYPAVEKKRLDDYPPSKRDEYAAKRDEYKSRDDYKRPVDDYRRNDTFKRNGGVIDDYKRDMDRPMQTIDNRYPDARGSSTGAGDYRGNGSRDDRDRSGPGPKGRFMDQVEGRYQDRTGGGSGGGSGGGPWHNNAGPPQMSMTPAMTNDGWRMDNGQDRYDRTYNERKVTQMSAGPFMDPSRQGQFMSGGGGGGRPQDRYGAPVSGRFDNGRY